MSVELMDKILGHLLHAPARIQRPEEHAQPPRGHLRRQGVVNRYHDMRAIATRIDADSHAISADHQQMRFADGVPWRTRRIPASSVCLLRLLEVGFVHSSFRSRPWNQLLNTAIVASGETMTATVQTALRAANVTAAARANFQTSGRFMACAGDVPTLETLAAVSIIREHLPDLKVRVVNVVDLTKLEPQTEHPHGLSDADFDSIFTSDKPIVFAFHGYPWLIHRLAYRRTNHRNLHVRGYKEEGTITTPFDMTVLNDIDRFHLVLDVIDRVPLTSANAAHLKLKLQEKRVEHKEYIRKHGR